MHPQDLAEQGFQDRDLVDVVSTFQGADRRAEKFRLVAYPTAKGCAAAYFPEANVGFVEDDHERAGSFIEFPGE